MSLALLLIIIGIVLAILGALRTGIACIVIGLVHLAAAHGGAISPSTSAGPGGAFSRPAPAFGAPSPLASFIHLEGWQSG